MLTSNDHDQSCSSTGKSSDVEREVEAEESGWTDCFSWDDLLYTGRDLAAAAQSPQIKRVSRFEACNYELTAGDAMLAKEARECLIADQYTAAAGAPNACNIQALRVRQFHDEHHQLSKVRVRSKYFDNLTYNQGYCIAASSMASDASSGPPSSSLLPASHQLMEMTTGLYRDAGALLDTIRMDSATHSQLGVSCKSVRGTFHDSAVQDTCSKTRRFATQSNLHPSSSFSAAHPPGTSSQVQCSAAEPRLPATSHVVRTFRTSDNRNIVFH